MKVLVLNWTKGDNDAFTYGNQLIVQYLRDYGKPAYLLDLEDPNLLNILQSEKETGIEFVLTCQGLGAGSFVGEKENGINLWDYLKIPLICVHADHPSIAPANHALESPYCKHLYYDEEACLFSNRYFRKTASASLTYTCALDVPPDSPPAFEGKYFVFMKNLNPPDEMERSWKSRFDEAVYTFFMSVVEEVKALVLKEQRFISFHDILERRIAEHDTLHVIHHPNNRAVFFMMHSFIDHYIRAFKSVELLQRLKGYPIKIFGRGWESYREKASPSHDFSAGVSMVDSKALYYSEYGVLDVSPFRGLHDRSLRAIVNRTAFLSDADIRNRFLNYQEYTNLFYDFTAGDIESTCENVIRNPKQHRELAMAFSREHQLVNRASGFIDSLNTHLQSMGGI